MHDSATAEALKPWFGILSPAAVLQRRLLRCQPAEYVKLAAALQVDEITPTGVVVDGQLHEVDIIFATGFETGTSAADLFGYDITGCDGLALSEYSSTATRPCDLAWVPKLLRTGPQPERVHRQLHVHARSESSPRGPAPRAPNRSITEIEPSKEAGTADSRSSGSSSNPGWLTSCSARPATTRGEADLSRSFWVVL